jgi:hypothetical protein
LPADCCKADQVFIMIVIVVCSFPPNARHQRPAQPVRCMPLFGSCLLSLWLSRRLKSIAVPFRELRHIAHVAIKHGLVDVNR